MKMSDVKNYFFNYHRMNSKKSTLKNYEMLLSKFCEYFGDRELDSLMSEEILTFLTEITEGTKQSTKRLRYALLSSFFNFNKLPPSKLGGFMSRTSSADRLLRLVDVAL